jgi:hypothetical protein
MAEDAKKEEVVVNVNVPVPVPTPVYKPKAGMYKVIRDKMIVLASGAKMKKTPEGYYDPKTEEEKDLCKQFAELAILEVVK